LRINALVVSFAIDLESFIFMVSWMEIQQYSTALKSTPEMENHRRVTVSSLVFFWETTFSLRRKAKIHSSVHVSLGSMD
jgi:hypothetical protein